MLRAEVGVDAPDGHIHGGEPSRRGVALLPVDGDVADAPAVLLDELLGLHEHAAGAAAGVVDPRAGRGREHLDEHADDAARCVELPALLALGTGKLAQEILVDAPEDVLAAVLGVAKADGANEVDQLAEPMLVQRGAGEVFRQDALEPGVVALDGDHGVVHQLPDAGLLGVALKVFPPRLFRHPEVNSGIGI